jgi:hypothetical protein
LLLESNIDDDDDDNDKVSRDRKRKTRAILKKMRERE